MNKKLIVLTVATLATPPVLAQSSVVIYGTVDAGFAWRGSHVDATQWQAVPGAGSAPSPGDAKSGVRKIGSRSALDSGLSEESRIGVRATENLGAGAKAGFVLEQGVKVDTGESTQPGMAFGRQSYVMLGNELGTVRMGRQFTAHHDLGTLVDPFAKGTVGRFDNVYLSEMHADNMFAYASPVWGGFSFSLAYSLNSSGPESVSNRGQGNDIDIRMAAFQPRYVRGPLMVGVNVHALTAKSDNPDLHGKRVFVYDLMGTYDFGSAKLAYAYGLRKADVDFSADGAFGGGDSRQWMLGVTMPVGHAGRFMTSYAQRRTEADWLGGDAKVNQWAVGYEHDLSKRTTLYAVYANLNNNALAEQALRDNADSITYANAPERALKDGGTETCIPGKEVGDPPICTPDYVQATLTPNNVGGSLGDASNPGEGAQRAINIGIRHRF